MSENLEIVVLLVDDDEFDRRIVKRSFKDHGLNNRVVEAENGEQALEFLKKNQVEDQHHILVLLDINMPVMDGHQFLDALRADSKLSTTTVFILTSSDIESDKRKAYKKNVAGYLTKVNLAPNFAKEVAMLGKYILTVKFPSVS